MNFIDGRAMFRAVLRTGFTWVALGAGSVGVAAQDAPTLETLLRGRVEALRNGSLPYAADDRLLTRAALSAFYEERGYLPAWVGQSDMDDLLTALVGSIRVAPEHGLEWDDYHGEAIESLLIRASRETLTLSDQVDLELLASDAFMLLGSHLLHGRVNPETINPEWLANRRSADLHRVLAAALDQRRIEAALYADLAPQQPRYQSMLIAAARLRRVESEGGWPRVEAGPRLEVGVDDSRVAALRTRLRASADLQEGRSVSGAFDEALADGVRAFQTRHGLDVDGVVGPATLAALNVSAADRARQIEVNLERWRWLPADLGERHIEVNIAGFDVKVVEGGRTVRRHRAVVGRQYRETPMFSGSMTYMVLSPYWHVPPTIAAVDKLPQIKQSTEYLAAQRMTLLDQRSNQPVDPASVDWTGLSGPDFNRQYRLRQDPGPSNALGAVKFMFPNAHNVYLHDTPSRELFDRASRSFSSGCIRVERPLDLAEYLLADQPDWTRTRIDQAAGKTVEQTVRLTRAVPVHLLYWTAWADEEGLVHFRTDIYGRDQTVRRALDAEPPGA